MLIYVCIILVLSPNPFIFVFVVFYVALLYSVVGTYILRHFQVYLKAACVYWALRPLLDMVGTTITVPVVKELRPRLLSWRDCTQTQVKRLEKWQLDHFSLFLFSRSKRLSFFRITRRHVDSDISFASLSSPWKWLTELEPSNGWR